VACPAWKFGWGDEKANPRYEKSAVNLACIKHTRVIPRRAPQNFPSQYFLFQTSRLRSAVGPLLLRFAFSPNPGFQVTWDMDCRIIHKHLRIEVVSALHFFFLFLTGHQGHDAGGLQVSISSLAGQARPTKTKGVRWLIVAFAPLFF
jgi:hypothetical protein